jgi:hypothetical protein
MAVKKSTVKKSTVKKSTAKKAAALKLTHSQLSRLTVKHFPKIKAAARKALRAAGLHALDVDHMMFRADLAQGSDPCQGKCSENQTCMLSSTGDFKCVPNTNN